MGAPVKKGMDAMQANRARATGLAAMAVLVVLAAAEAMGAERRFTLGGRIGLNLSRLAFETLPPEVNDRIHPAMVGGMFLGVRLQRYLQCEAGLGAASQGGRVWYYERGPLGSRVDETIELTYIELPLKLNFTAPWRRLPLVVGSGPRLAYLLSAEKRTLRPANHPTATLVQDIEDGLQSLAVSWLFSAGLRFPAGKTTVLVDVTFDLGLREISEESHRARADFGSITNQSWVLAVGIAR